MSAKAPPRSPLFAQICAALIALTCCRLPGADLAGLQKGLLLHVPFEATLSPALANGSGEITCPGATYADGTVGKGVVVTDAAVSVLGEGNFRRPLGTVAFWVAPAWSPADTSYQGHRQLFDATNFAINYYTPKRVAFFMTGKTRKGVGYRWDYSVTSTGIRDWEPGEWHHVAATWNAATGRKTLCLDGAVAAEGTTQWLRDDLYMGTVPIRLGQKEAPGIYDEWMIWERCLSLDEIKLLAAHPERIAESLEARSASSSEPAPWPIDIGIVTTVPPAATVLAPGDTFTADIPVRNTTSTPFAGQIQFALLDFWEATRGRETRRIVVEPGTSDTLTVSFPAPVRGVFKVAAELTQRKNVWVRDVASFACWPKPTHAPSQDSFFGNHVNAWFDGAYLDQAQRLGQGWMRNHNMLQATWWVRVQPEPGEFQWTHDFQIDAVKTRAMPVLGQLFTTPYWAAVDGPVPRPNARAYPPPLPPDLDALRAYVGAVVTRYGNTTKHWEVWNEPDVSMFWRGSPEAFAAACQAACEAAKSADPDCVLMVGGFTSPAWGWHERAARAGALKSADAISFHYGCPLKPAEEVHAELQTVINHFQRLAREFGPGHDLPLWSTEGGTGDTTWLRGMDYVGLPPQRVRKPMNWHEGAIATVRGEAIQQVLGIERHFIYLQNAIKPGPHAYEGTSMLDVTNAPRPKLMARVAMAAQVDGATVAGCITVPEARLWAVVYRKPPPLGSVVLWWTGRDGIADVTVRWPGPVERRVDIMGNTMPRSQTTRVSWEPTYTHVKASATETLAAVQNARVTELHAAVPLANATQDLSHGVPVMPDYVAPDENAAGVFTIDLSPSCNMGFADDTAGDGRGGWSDEGPLNDMRCLPPGKRRFYGVPFVIIDPALNKGKSVITLRSRTSSQTLPESVAVTFAPRRCRALYFLHASAWGTPGEIGEYTVTYADEQIAHLPLTIPGNTGNWWTPPQDGETGRTVPVRVDNTPSGTPEWRYLRVWEWQNPRRNVPIHRIDVHAGKGKQMPILIAVTGV